MSERILRRPDVEKATGLSRSTIYAAIKTGEFPAPVRLTGRRAVGWRETDIEEFIRSRSEVPAGRAAA